MHDHHASGRIWRMTSLRSVRSRSESTDAPTVGVEPIGHLLSLAARGQQEAFAQLYDALAPMVHGVVLRIVRDPAMSEEVTQEVFVELWRHAARFDERAGSVKAWASTIAHRRAVDRVRSEQSSRARLEADGTKRVIEPDGPAAQVESSLDAARVRRALGHLNERQREAIELAYFGGHSYREVAVLLDVAEGTIKTRIRDGMIRLRDELGEPQ
jgi:RNA polymerase sigma-70 factor (ECF subfamily)